MKAIESLWITLTMIVITVMAGGGAKGAGAVAIYGLALYVYLKLKPWGQVRSPRGERQPMLPQKVERWPVLTDRAEWISSTSIKCLKCSTINAIRSICAECSERLVNKEETLAMSRKMNEEIRARVCEARP